jgi:hypothetical protein
MMMITGILLYNYNKCMENIKKCIVEYNNFIDFYNNEKNKDPSKISKEIEFIQLSIKKIHSNFINIIDYVKDHKFYKSMTILFNYFKSLEYYVEYTNALLEIFIEEVWLYFKNNQMTQKYIEKFKNLLPRYDEMVNKLNNFKSDTKLEVPNIPSDLNSMFNNIMKTDLSQLDINKFENMMKTDLSQLDINKFDNMMKTDLSQLDINKFENMMKTDLSQLDINKFENMMKTDLSQLDINKFENMMKTELPQLELEQMNNIMKGIYNSNTENNQLSFDNIINQLTSLQNLSTELGNLNSQMNNLNRSQKRAFNKKKKNMN